MKKAFFVAALSICLISTALFAQWIENPERVQGLKAPAPAGDYTLVNIKGPGEFVSAHVTKQGGRTDMTFISIDIDGRNVVSVSMAALKNWGLNSNNPYGLMIVNGTGDIKTVTIGFTEPLKFNKEFRLSVKVAEPDVVQILANVITGK